MCCSEELTFNSTLVSNFVLWAQAHRSGNRPITWLLPKLDRQTSIANSRHIARVSAIQHRRYRQTASHRRSTYNVSASHVTQPRCTCALESSWCWWRRCRYCCCCCCWRRLLPVTRCRVTWSCVCWEVWTTATRHLPASPAARRRSSSPCSRKFTRPHWQMICFANVR